MKKSILLLVAMALMNQFSWAQSTAEEDVKAVIMSLFDGMRAKSGEQVSAAFTPDALMQTVISDEKGTRIGSNAVSDFASRVGSTGPDVQLDERILDYQIKVDGDMAAAWTPYEFYVNDKFSHCGVNSFQLVKLPEGWKIVYIIDTRRKEGC
ncbi:nuclear transport factor 2 family protein [Algoriphagus zhangzhouensis]|uniref:Putative lumazine-binding n=1 Tax=Algoriphagus zhangzhouensis TaxID=1073327 RepID=A0A1M7Z9M3_9BACT|nr:nuclear transport factor 2 family protein [Algoriphagus zhangzhouensis]TDY47513.1 putative lumazine-binding protein [Algoriphagus zhangzhouensis]SHO61366.1 Putative lumazine-binding [Algoriphagus zhangzhouensis]